MRILLLNPNTSPGITALLDGAARTAIAVGTELVSVTAPRGVPYIASRAEAAIGGVVALEMLAELHAGFDAAIIAAFADPGLGAARELFPIPVVGLAEAGMLTACMLGARFGIVTFTPALEAWYQECIAWHRLEPRCAGVFALDEGFSDIVAVQDEKAEALVALAGRAIAGGADVIVLAGAPLSGLAARVRERIAVPVVDCAVAAVKQAEALVALRVVKATQGSFRRPAAKPVVGVEGALGLWIAGERS
jgi:Asp/Glu/hydantoin racemase